MESPEDAEITERSCTFYTVEGLIVSVTPESARRQLAQLRRLNPGLAPWELENILNHEHLPVQRTRADLRRSEHEVEVLARALKAAYPERRFVVVNRLGAETLSFFQQSAGAKLTDSEPKASLLTDTCCPACNQRRPYRLRSTPDAEFPELEWAECAICGGELYLQARTRFHLIPNSQKEQVDTLHVA